MKQSHKQKMNFVLVLFFVIFGTLVVHAKGPVLTRADAEAAFAKLLQIDRFAFGPTSDGGETFEGETYFCALFDFYGKDPQFVTTKFEELIHKGSTPAKLYGLTGFYYKDKTKFEQYAKEVQTQALEVKCMKGCVVFSQKVSEVIKEITSGEYDNDVLAKRM